MKYFYFTLIPILIFSCRYRTGIEPLSVSSEFTSSLELNTDGFRAVVLADGKVFLSGASSEEPSHKVYDPALRSWESVASSPNSFQYHEGVLLEDGRVLLAGGYQQKNMSTERPQIGSGSMIFDPATNTWGEGGNMNLGRVGFSLVALANGKWMAIGGVFLQESSTSARKFPRITASVEFYDPNTNTWALGPSMTQERANHETLALVDGRQLVLGGDATNFSGEIYDPVSNSWSAIETPTFEFGRDFRATMLDEDHVLLSGGRVNSILGNTQAAIYTVSTDTWELASSMAEGRYNHTLIFIKPGRLLAIGGKSKLDDHPFYPTVEATALCELYDMKTNTWRSIGSLRMPRSDHQSIMLNSTEILTISRSFGNDQGAELQILK